MKPPFGFVLAAMLGLALVPISGVAVSQANVMVFIATIDDSSGETITDVCYTIVEASNEGCDDNGDGSVRFDDVAPGEYTIQATTQPGSGFLPIGEFPISVTGDEFNAMITVSAFPANGDASPVDVTVKPVDAVTDDPLTGMCFVLHGGSNQGCDENSDGTITFDAVSAGGYLLSQTRDYDGYGYAEDAWVAVDSDHDEIVVSVQPTTPGGSELVDIALVTRDPESSDLVEGNCFELIGVSNVGCDQNTDRRVTFDDVPPGIHQVRQTFVSTGYDIADPFRIEVVPDLPTQGILVKQARVQTTSGTRNVSVMIVDSQTGALVTESGACITLGVATAEGCDDNEDGQIDFLDVPYGTYYVITTVKPQGGGLGDGPTEITVEGTESTNVTGVVAFVAGR